MLSRLRRKSGARNDLAVTWVFMALLAAPILGAPWTARAATKVGSDWVLQGGESVAGDLYIDEGTVDLNGFALMVEGDLIQSGGTLKVNGGTLAVAGDYRIQTEKTGKYATSHGYLAMTDPADRVIVNGSFITQSLNDHTGYLTAGSLEIKGGFRQLRGTSGGHTGSPYNFLASGSHRVVLNGPNVQTVRFENHNESRFNALVITKPLAAGYIFTCPTPVWNTLGEDFGDREPPSAPVIAVAAKSDSFIELTWEASTDNARVDGYEIYRNGARVATVLTPGYTDRGLQAGRIYVYNVRAYDSSGNAAVSGALSVETNRDQSPPSAPGGLVFTERTETSFVLSWQASTDDAGVKGYEVFRDGEKVAETAETSYSESGLTPGISHVYTVRAFDHSGNRSAAGAPIYFDRRPPPPPTELAAPAATENTISLTWTASVDDMIVSGYDIYRDGAMIASTAETGFVVAGLSPLTTYVFAVRARDGAGNVSAESELLFAATEPDLAAPTAPADPVIAARSPDSVSLSWQASTDNVGVAGYEIFRDGEAAGRTAETAYTDAGVAPGSSHTYTIEAFDAAGNHSPASAPVYFDNQAPTVPARLAASGRSVTGITLSWAAATDDVGVSGYEIHLDGAMVGTTSETRYTLAGLAPGTAYTITVKAYDAAGNVSAPGAALVVETEPDTAPPGAPGSPRVAAKTGSTVTLAWEAAADNVAVARYEVWRDGAAIAEAAGLEYTDTGLMPNHTYCYEVKAVDGAGNVSPSCESIYVIPLLPSIIAVEPADGAVIGGAAPWTLRIFCAGAGGLTIDRVEIEYSADGVTWHSCGIASAPVRTDENTLAADLSWGLEPLGSGIHHLRFTVYDAAGHSDTLTVGYKVDRTAPAAPVGLRAESGAGTVELSWQASPEDDLDRYLIYRSTEEAGPFELLAEVGGGEGAAYADRTAEPGRTYYYRLTAVDRFEQESTGSGTVRIVVPVRSSGADEAVTEVKMPR